MLIVIAECTLHEVGETWQDVNQQHRDKRYVQLSPFLVESDTQQSNMHRSDDITRQGMLQTDTEGSPRRKDQRRRMYLGCTVVCLAWVPSDTNNRGSRCVPSFSCSSPLQLPAFPTAFPFSRNCNLTPAAALCKGHQHDVTRRQPNGRPMAAQPREHLAPEQ